MVQIEIHNAVSIKERIEDSHMRLSRFFNSNYDRDPFDYSRCYIGAQKDTDNKKHYINYVASRQRFFKLLEEIHRNRINEKMLSLNYKSGDITCTIYKDSSNNYRAKLKGLKSGYNCSDTVFIDIEQLDYISREVYGRDLKDKVENYYNQEIKYEKDYVIISMENSGTVKLDRKNLFDKIINLISRYQGSIEHIQYNDMVVACKSTERECYKCSSTKSNTKIGLIFEPSEPSPFVYCKDCIIDIIDDYRRNIEAEIISKKI
jgi:hypothetical protein